MHTRFSFLTVCTLLLLAGCRSSTGPKVVPPTHPAGTLSSQIANLHGRPFAVRVTQSGDVLVTEQDANRAVHVTTLSQNGTEITVGFDPGEVLANRTGTRAFVSAFNDGTVSVVDLTSNQVTGVMRPSSTNAYRLALSSDESRLFVTSVSGDLYSMNTGTNAVSTSIQLGAALQGIAIDQGGQNLYVSATSGTLWRLDPGSLGTTKTSSVAQCQAQDIALSTDASELYVACENGKVAVLDPTTLATKAIIPIAAGGPFGLAVTPDNAQIYVSAASAGKVVILDRASRGIVTTLAVGGVPRRIAFNAHGDKGYIANEGNWVDVIQ